MYYYRSVFHCIQAHYTLRSLLLTLVRGSMYTLTLVLDYRCSYMAAISVKNRFEIQATLTIWVQVGVIGG